MLDDIASQASSRLPAPLMITARAQKKRAWRATVPVSLRAIILEKRLGSAAHLAVASLHPSALLPAAMASGAGATPWPKKLLWATARAAGLTGTYHLWQSWLSGTTAAPAAVPSTTSAPQTLALRQSRPQVGRNASKFPFTFDQYDPDFITHARYGTLLLPFIEKRFPTDFYRL